MGRAKKSSTRVAIYIRISTGKGMQLEGHSLDAQLNICRKLAEDRGWEIVVIYREEGASAKTTKRPQFRRMMRDAHAGLFDVIIVHKLDRFSRSVADVLTIMNELEELNVAFISFAEQFDFTTPIGRATLTMMAAFAQWYLDNLSQETAKGKRARAEKGLWNSAVPFGYAVDYKKDGGDGLAYPDEDEREGVLYAFEQYVTGMYSNNDIARLLNEADYRPKGRGERALRLFSKDTVTDILQNRFYLGEVQYKGEWYEGVHEPIIPEELFERCQRVRQQRRPRLGTTARSGSRVYPLTGIARCARCGGRMRGSYASGKRYYRDPARQKGCDCDQSMVRAGDTEEALGGFLERLALPADWKEQVMALIQTHFGEERDVLREQARIENELKRLTKLFQWDDISEDEYRTERNRLRARRAALTPPMMPDLERAAELLRDFGTLWDGATLQERRQIVHTLLQTVYLDSGEKGPVVAIEPKSEFAPLFEMLGSGVDGDIVLLKPGAEFSPVARGPLARAG